MTLERSKSLRVMGPLNFMPVRAFCPLFQQSWLIAHFMISSTYISDWNICHLFRKTK